MTSAAASRWYTAAEISQLGLPGLPDSKRSVNALAAAEGWAQRIGPDGWALARPRGQSGGGLEYHASLFPPQAQELLIGRQAPPVTAANDTSGTLSNVVEAWRWLGEQSAAIRERAEGRLAIIVEVEASVAAGVSKSAAIQAVARRRNASPRAIFGWFADVAGIAPAHRLPFLAPRYQSGGKEVEINAEAWQALKTDYLRPEKPAFSACYRRLAEYARTRGITLPSAKTLQRRLEREISGSLKTTKRSGREASRRAVPPQQRSVADLHAMQIVNVDGHKFDVFVEWEDGKIGRPMMVGIQDVYSRKLLAHKIDKSESTLLTRLAFADLFRDHGIPAEAVMDNGRAFASKALTGGALTRFRFKVKDTDALGILPMLGIKVHWTLPYRGSSKPIERAWRDLCEDVAKHPAMSGAYTGNKPDAKPENYRERAIPIAEFRAHVARQIIAHNARDGRRTETGKRGSFDAAFAASYAVSPIGRAKPEQLRMALLEALPQRAHREHGTVTIAGNRYWSPEMSDLAGKMVILRFDPDDLRADVHVYSDDGRYLLAAPVINSTGFRDRAGAVQRAKLEADHRRMVKAQEEAADLLHVDRLAELYSDPLAPPTPPRAAVIRPVRHRGQTAAALKPLDQAAFAPAAPTMIDKFAAAVNRLRVVE